MQDRNQAENVFSEIFLSRNKLISETPEHTNKYYITAVAHHHCLGRHGDLDPDSSELADPCRLQGWECGPVW